MNQDKIKQAFEKGAKVQKFWPCGTDENLEGGHWLNTHNPQWEKGVEYRLDPNAPENWLTNHGDQHDLPPKTTT